MLKIIYISMTLISFSIYVESQFEVCIQYRDMDKMNNTTVEKNRICSLHGITLNEKEEEILQYVVCENNKQISTPLLILTLEANTIFGNKSYYTICRYGKIGQLAWLKWNDKKMGLLQNELQEGPLYAAFSLLTQSLCALDLKTGKCQFLNNRTQSSSDTTFELLIERYPIRYEIKDVKHKNWHNVTDLEDIDLGSTFLENISQKEQNIVDSIEYNFEEVLSIDITELGLGPNIPITYRTEDNSIIELNGKGERELQINSTSALIRELAPGTGLNVTLIGTKQRIFTEFSANLIKVFSDDSKISQPIETKITKITVKDIMEKYSEPTLLKDIEVDPLKSGFNHRSHSKTVYPEFYPVFIVASILVGGVAIIAFVDICWRTRNDRNLEKRRIDYNQIQLK